MVSHHNLLLLLLLLLLCHCRVRLVTKAGKELYPGQEYVELLNSPSKRAEQWSKVKGLNAAYPSLVSHLQNKEWGAGAYEAAYKQDIFGCS